MATTSIAPAGYHSIQPYLIFKDAQAAIGFYSLVFDASERLCMKDPSGHVAHAELTIGDSCIMLADERPEIAALSPSHFGGSPISLTLYVANCDAVYHHAIECGATGTREPADQPYGDRTAGFVDPFGYTWYLATHLRDVSKEELEEMMKHPYPTSA